MINTEEKKETIDVVEPYITIIKYLNHQKLKINNEWLSDIKNICDGEDLDLTTVQVSSVQLTQIKKLYYIYQNSNVKDSVPSSTFLYYIFIILNLPNYLLKNITRSYLSKLYLEKEIKTSLSYFNILERNLYLDDLILILDETRDVFNIFLETINHFFT